jgi:hypothetical protein
MGRWRPVSEHCDQFADERDRIADEGDRTADARETRADEREQRLNAWEHDLAERSGQIRTADRADVVDGGADARARGGEAMERSSARLDRAQAAWNACIKRTDREQAEIDRETASTARKPGFL